MKYEDLILLIGFLLLIYFAQIVAILNKLSEGSINSKSEFWLNMIPFWWIIGFVIGVCVEIKETIKDYKKLGKKDD